MKNIASILEIASTFDVDYKISNRVVWNAKNDINIGTQWTFVPIEEILISISEIIYDNLFDL